MIHGPYNVKEIMLFYRYIIVTFTKGICNYRTEINHVARTYELVTILEFNS